MPSCRPWSENPRVGGSTPSQATNPLNNLAGSAPPRSLIRSRALLASRGRREKDWRVRCLAPRARQGSRRKAPLLSRGFWASKCRTRWPSLGSRSSNESSGKGPAGRAASGRSARASFAWSRSPRDTFHLAASRGSEIQIGGVEGSDAAAYAQVLPRWRHHRRALPSRFSPRARDVAAAPRKESDAS
jgi:hypothetical protein